MCSSAAAPVLILTHRRTSIILSTRSSATVSADNRCLLWTALLGRLLLRVAVFNASEPGSRPVNFARITISGDGEQEKKKRKFKDFIKILNFRKMNFWIRRTRKFLLVFIREKLVLLNKNSWELHGNLMGNNIFYLIWKTLLYTAGHYKSNFTQRFYKISLTRSWTIHRVETPTHFHAYHALSF